MRYRQNTKGDILYGSPVKYSLQQIYGKENCHIYAYRCDLRSILSNRYFSKQQNLLIISCLIVISMQLNTQLRLFGKN